MKTHEGFMRRCLDLAGRAGEEGNTPVGAVIVKAGKIVAEGLEQVPEGLDVTAHAEVNAVRGACLNLGTVDLSGCTLYSTAEPCWLCAYAVREARITVVVYGRKSADVGAVTSAFPMLLTKNVAHWGEPPEIVRGVLEDACLALIKRV